MRLSRFAIIAILSILTCAASAGNISFLQYENEWFISHGENVLFHGTGKVDFNNLPPFIAEVVAELDSTEPSVPARRAAARKEGNTVIGPIIQTEWHQYAPYNELMPVIDGNNVPAGCTTIATAQLVNYYRYMKPWSTDYFQIAYGDVQHGDIYKWYDPQDVWCQERVYRIHHTSEGWTEDITPAKLCEEIAIAQRSTFKPGETGTFVNDQWRAILKLFGYEAKYIDPTADRIPALLQEQLDMGRPVLISGVNSALTGHSFICDGYNSNGEYHLNLGWGEGWNCWSAVNAWEYGKNNLITLYPDYDGNSPYVIETEPGTAVFRNLTTGETFSSLMTVSGNYDSATGLPDSSSVMYEVQLTAGRYEYYVEYSDGRKLSAALPDPSAWETFTLYNHSSSDFIASSCEISIPYPCHVTFYATYDIYGLNMILQSFDRGTVNAGDISLSLTGADSDYKASGKADYSQTVYDDGQAIGTYIVKLDNVPAGKYTISGTGHNDEVGDFHIGINPTVDIGFIEVTDRNYGSLDYYKWLQYYQMPMWSCDSNDEYPPMKIILSGDTQDMYTVVLFYETGAGQRIGIYAQNIKEKPADIPECIYVLGADSEFNPADPGFVLMPTGQKGIYSGIVNFDNIVFMLGTVRTEDIMEFLSLGFGAAQEHALLGLHSPVSIRRASSNYIYVQEYGEMALTVDLNAMTVNMSPASAVGTPVTAPSDDACVTDLYGRKFSPDTVLPHGIYIRNGSKHLVR